MLVRVQPWSPMIITLIGYRGSGKSTIAKVLAQRLGMNWLDSDDLIEERAGKTICEIFNQDGEAAFRILEQNVLKELFDQNDLVIATGGGAILSEESRRLMCVGPVVWLRASLETLHSRIQADAGTATRRPNLGTIEEILSSRQPLYKEVATTVINTDGLSAEAIVDRIVVGLA